MTTVTQWFDMESPPVRKGHYETDAMFGGCFQYWTGAYWGLTSRVVSSDSLDLKKSLYQDVAWRGLARKPRKGGAK